MKLVVPLAALALLALSLVPAPASASPPVCLEKSVALPHGGVDVLVDCGGPRVTVWSCPAVGSGPCWMAQTPPLSVLA